MGGTYMLAVEGSQTKADSVEIVLRTTVVARIQRLPRTRDVIRFEIAVGGTDRRVQFVKTS
jgi:hypothetical protein